MNRKPPGGSPGRNQNPGNGRLLLEIRVPRGDRGVRLDEVIASLLADAERTKNLALRVTKSKIRRLLMAGAVRVDGRTVRQPAWEVRPGQRVSADLDVKLFAAEKDPGDLVWKMGPGDILFEDEWLLAVNKPAGLPTEGTVVASRDSLHAAVRRYLSLRASPAEGNQPYLGLHHRLDRETSGVLLFTKKEAANKGVHEMFLRHTARKTYLALTAAGTVREGGSLINPGESLREENRIGRISPKSAQGKWGADEKGDWAATDFTLLKAGRGLLLWEAGPLTGRTHQIRVHLAGLGYPLLGDALYGGPEMLGSEKVPRVMLHALGLTFPHPVTGLRTTVRAPLPADFLALLPPRWKEGPEAAVLESLGEMC